MSAERVEAIARLLHEHLEAARWAQANFRWEDDNPMSVYRSLARAVVAHESAALAAERQRVEAAEHHREAAWQAALSYCVRALRDRAGERAEPVWDAAADYLNSLDPPSGSHDFLFDPTCPLCVLSRGWRRAEAERDEARAERNARARDVMHFEEELAAERQRAEDFKRIAVDEKERREAAEARVAALEQALRECAEVLHLSVAAARDYDDPITLRQIGADALARFALAPPPQASR